MSDERTVLDEFNEHLIYRKRRGLSWGPVQLFEALGIDPDMAVERLKLAVYWGEAFLDSVQGHPEAVDHQMLADLAIAKRARECTATDDGYGSVDLGPEEGSTDVAEAVLDHILGSTT